MLLKYIDREVKKIRREWQTHRRKIAKQISPSQRSILAELDDIFFNATAKLLVDLQSPTLTIVTTGTTSSGKKHVSKSIMWSGNYPCSRARNECGIGVDRA
jgi:hypothetical protein